MSLFSAIGRQDIIKQMKESSFDVLVIGGGITGAGIALDASARGLKVALIEMQDFAAGTSSRSTKLIHGGLRYLKQMEFKLVAEVGREREIIRKNAPHLTRPEKMLLPIVKGGSLGKVSVRFGMWLYEWLAGVKKKEACVFLDAQQTMQSEPLLKKEGLLGGALFYEYRTDDARLTIEIIKEAVNRGALAVNYMRASEFIYENEKVSGVKATDQQSGEIFNIYARCVINATGPWVDEVDDLDRKHDAHKLHITKGVHIVVDRKKLPVHQSVYFDTFDGRMMFVIPRNEKTYIGTTDTFYDGDLINPQVLEEDKTYLLKCVNAYFPSSQLGMEHIESCWAGIRPLVNKPGKGPSEISRKDEIFVSGSGLIIIAGGKLTGYRKMAERIVDLVAKRMVEEGGKRIADCSTDKIRVAGGKLRGAFEEFRKEKVNEGINLGLTALEAGALVDRYGSNADELYMRITELKKRSPEHDSNLPLILQVQVKYVVENEMCATPSDFFIRRTGLLYFDIDTVKKCQIDVTLYMQKLLLWDHDQREKYLKELQRAIAEI